jgi:hypothetical protein
MHPHTHTHTQMWASIVTAATSNGILIIGSSYGNTNDHILCLPPQTSHLVVMPYMPAECHVGFDVQ